MYKLQSHIPTPKLRRKAGDPTKFEKAQFEAYIAAYRTAHGCKLTLGYFDVESRIQVFEGPTFVEAHTARRCKELIRQLNFRT